MFCCISLLLQHCSSLHLFDMNEMNRKKTEMVVFDMAGTTVDENNLVYKTLRSAINDAGFDFSLEQVLAEGAGKEKKQAIQSVLAIKGISDATLSDDIYNDFIVRLADAYAVEEILAQPNALKVLSALKKRDIKVVLDTGYDSATANLILEKLGWLKGREFDLLVTASDVPRNRPYPDMIDLAREYFMITDSKKVIKVGDSTIDVLEGKNAGCGLSIGITTGAHTAAQLISVEPDYIIDDLEELLKLVD
jgi:phosphonatase-like hydrolase